MKRIYFILIVLGLGNISNAQSNDSSGVENWRIGLNYIDSFDGDHIFGLSAIQTRKSLIEYEASINYDYETGNLPTYKFTAVISNVGVHFFLTNKNKYHRRVSFIPTANLYLIYTKQTNSSNDPSSYYFYSDGEDYYAGIMAGFKINFKCSERFSIRLQLEYGFLLDFEHFNSYLYSYNSIYNPFNRSVNTIGLHDYIGIPFLQLIYRLK